MGIASRRILSVAAAAVMVASAGCIALDDPLAGPAPGAGDAAIHESAQPIINGTPTNDYPAVGEVIAGTEDVFCTGTLIGCSTVITAAHCVCAPNTSCDLRAASDTKFFLPHAGIYQVQGIDPNPAFNADVSSSLKRDVAILHLAEPVTGIQPMAINTTQTSPGDTLTVVGYGRNSPYDNIQVGVKRIGSETATSCSTLLGSEDELENLCSTSGDRTCQGDSGGPHFIGSGSTARVAGITSYGYDGGSGTPDMPDCAGGKVATEVAANLTFIQDAAGADLGTSDCEGYPVLGDGGAEQHTFGTLSQGDVLELAIDVPVGTSELRVTWNGYDYFDDGGSTRRIATTFTATPGRPTGTDELRLTACGGTSRACIVGSPSPGPWTARLHLDKGEGQYQLTAATYGGAPTAEPDQYDVEENSYIEVKASKGVLTNDAPTDRGGSARLASGPMNGQLELHDDGSFIYQPFEDYLGSDSFTYVIDDGTYHSGPATVELHVVESTGGSGGCSATDRGARSSALAYLLALSLALLALPRRRARRA